MNPLAGVLSPTALNPDVRYEFAIDNNGDFEEDIVYGVFASNEVPDLPPLPGLDGAIDDLPFLGGQVIVLDRSEGLLLGFGALPVAFGSTERIIDVGGDGQLFVGLRDDPFFFDLVAFLHQVKGAGGTRAFCDGDEVDFFAGTNVTAIVLEIPSSQLTDDGDSTVRVWGRVRDGGQVERMGLPTIATA